MATDNLSVVLHGIDDLRLEQRPIPKFNDDQVLLRMDCVGICGSDIHFLVNGRIADWVLTSPMVLGHESSATVYKVGKNVDSLKVGDRVAIEPGIPCRVCNLCKKGRYHLCTDMQFCSANMDGTLKRYFVHSPDYCYKLPEHVSMEEGALLEPLSVGVHACRRADICLGSMVAIFGAGPIGLVTMMTAKSMGADKILVVDLLQNRLDLAMELGADCTLLIEKGESEEDIVKKVQATLGAKPDRTIDCSGSEATNRLSILVTRSGGIVLIVGNGPINVSLPLMNALTREVDVRGTLRYDAYDYPIALHMVASGKVNLKKLITHHFDITETLEAFNTSRHGLNNAVKVIIHIQPKDSNNPK